MRNDCQHEVHHPYAHECFYGKQFAKQRRQTVSEQPLPQIISSCRFVTEMLISRHIDADVEKREPLKHLHAKI